LILRGRWKSTDRAVCLRSAQLGMTRASARNAGWPQWHLVTGHAHQRGRAGRPSQLQNAGICTQLCRSESRVWREATLLAWSRNDRRLDKTCRRVELDPGQLEILALMCPRIKDTGWMGLSFPSRTQHSGVTLQGISSGELLLIRERRTRRLP